MRQVAAINPAGPAPTIAMSYSFPGVTAAVGVSVAVIVLRECAGRRRKAGIVNHSRGRVNNFASAGNNVTFSVPVLAQVIARVQEEGDEKETAYNID